MSCLLLPSGDVRCWGDNDEGQLGLGSASGGHVPRRVPLPRPARRLRAHAYSLCALLDDGAVACWGGGFGAEPKVVPGLPATADVAAGDRFACALGRDARVRCFEGGGSGGASDARAEPELAPWVEDAVAVGAGAEHACALLRDGTVRCWGGNAFGQLGDGTEAPRSDVPVRVVGLERVARLEVGDESSCAFLDDGRVACWGSNLQGRLHGDDFSDAHDNPRPLPFPVAGLQQVSFGAAHACGLFRGGRVECWGADEFGETGPAAFGPRGPGRYGDVRAPLQVEAGSAHSCALLAGGDARGEPRVRCWGANFGGELGVPTRSAKWSRKPVVVRFR